MRKQRDAKELARALRIHAIRMVHAVNASHIGSCLSIADILAVLYGEVLRIDPAQPKWASRDRFILSKGHAAAIVYAALAEIKFIEIDELKEYCQQGSRLTGHVSHHVPGVELSTGSLGHGLSVGCGIALAGMRAGDDYRVFVVLSDGELDEGSNWEPIMFAAHHQLRNLTVIVDYNKQQSFGKVADVLSLEPLADKWQAFGWRVSEVNGHCHDSVKRSLTLASTSDSRPNVLIAHTIKGKGVTFMEDQLAWHYKSPNPAQLEMAIEEVARAA